MDKEKERRIEKEKNQNTCMFPIQRVIKLKRQIQRYTYKPKKIYIDLER